MHWAHQSSCKSSRLVWTRKGVHAGANDWKLWYRKSIAIYASSFGFVTWLLERFYHVNPSGVPCGCQVAQRFVWWVRQSAVIIDANVAWDISACVIIIIIIYPLTARVVGAPQMISQPVFSIFRCSLGCPLELAVLQACPFPHVVFPPLPLTACVLSNKQRL